MKDNKLKQLYFPHDIFADKDEKIVKMFYHFRKNIDKFSDAFIRKNFFHASFGLFWEIVQYLHRNELTVDEIPIIADELRADEEFVRLIIEEFNLFRIEKNGQIFSDRILKNLEKMLEVSNKNRDAAQVRWLISSFNKAYEEFFSEKPILDSKEIETLKKYNNQIPDLRGKLRDILYTLKNLKFKVKEVPDFKPCANWLLKGNNLAKLVNGEFGTLKHKKTEKELKTEQAELARQESERNKPSKVELQIESCSGKAEALSIIFEYYKGQKMPCVQRGRIFVLPNFRNGLMKKFDITDKEVIELWQSEGE